MCGWTGYVIGNLLKNSIEELWNGEKAENFRKSLLDESYKFCSKKACPYMANHTLEKILTDYEVPVYPQFCSLSYEEQCNYIYKFCREKKYIPMDNEQEKYKKIKAVIITLHSFNENTYQFLSGTILPVGNIIDNLRFIKSLKEQGIVNHFEIATVVCERNFREMPDFVRRSLEFNPDSIRLRFFEPYGVRSKSIEWFFDIRNPYHPYYEEFVRVMDDPILENPRVWKWQGESLSDFKEHPYFEEQSKVKTLIVCITYNY